MTIAAPEPLALDELSGRELLDVATEALHARRLAEVAEMKIAAQWAAVNGEPRRASDRLDPMTQPGGDGTPRVRDFAVPELAMARETHPATTRALMADTLDLVHRLPRIWNVVVSGRCEPWIARKVAVESRWLDVDRVARVDAAVAPVLAGGHAAKTVLDAATAAVKNADPETDARRREQRRHERYVRLSRSDENGYRHVIAKVTAGDAAWVMAMLERVADILSVDHGHDHNRDELLSLAFGWLARPADLLRLLLEHTERPEEPTDPHDQDARPVWQPSHLDRTLARLAELSVRQLAALRGKGTVFVHLTESALNRQAGLARVEGDGPMWVQHLAELLGHADVRLTPVADLHLRPRHDAYEHSEQLKDDVWLTAGGDVFPHSPQTATRGQVDFDHCQPYQPPDHGGPPGQTGAHNSAPLRRRHHRWKTFAGFRVRPAGPGRYLWQTPHGLCLLRDPEGTHRLTPEQSELMLGAPVGVDVYVGQRILSSLETVSSNSRTRSATTSATGRTSFIRPTI